MKPLGDVIAAVRRELESGVSSSSALGKTAWELERATARLQVILRPSPAVAGPAGIECLVPFTGASEPTEAGQVITLELSWRRGGQVSVTEIAAQPSSAAPVASGRGTDFESERREALAGVFGKPGGFYSHNRAEVFLSALAELSEADFTALDAALASGKTDGLAGEVALAFGQIANILRSGPAGSVERGSALLRSALHGISRTDLEQLIRSTWKNEGQLS